MSEKWLSLRKYADPNIIQNVCNIKNLRKLTQGGQSEIYVFNNTNLLVRNIIPSFQKNYRNEILTNLILTKVVTNDINPHFTISHKFHFCEKNKVFQLIEKFDGDISKFNTKELQRTSFYPQMLMGMLTLLNNDIRLNDVKSENILYKKLDSTIKLNYLIDNDIYSIETDIVYVYTDYGNSGRYQDKDIKNIADLNSVVKVSKGDTNISHTSSNFFLEFEDSQGRICGYDAQSAELIFKPIAGSRLKILKCVKERLKDMMKRGEIKKGVDTNLFRPEETIDVVNIDTSFID